MARYSFLHAEPGVDLAHEAPWFLHALDNVGRRLGQVLDIFSGARTSGRGRWAGAGFPGDPHDYTVTGSASAADVTVGGVPLGRYRGAHAAIAAEGLRTGDQPNFYKGQPDPSHVDAGRGHPTGIHAAPRGAGLLSAGQLEQLWIDGGGPPNEASLMAAIALAESRGDPHAHHVTPFENSKGLWQINVLANPRYASWKLDDPATNARAAVSIRKSQGLGAWTTYKSGAYRQFLGGGGGGASSSSPSRTRPDGSGDGSGFLDRAGAGFVSGLERSVDPLGLNSWLGGILNSPSAPWAFLKAALWLLHRNTWLRMVEFVTGMSLIAVGLAGFVLVFLTKDPAVRRTAETAVGFTAAGKLGKAATVIGSRASRAGARKRTSSASSSSAPKRRRELSEAEAEADSAQAERLKRARERGRRSVRAAESERRFRSAHPDYDVIPF